MIKNLGMVVSVSGLIILSGCGATTESKIASSVRDNSAAATQTEWELSENHPEKLFLDFRNEIKDSDLNAKKEICDHLNKIDIEKLTIFENEIRSSLNKNLLEGCAADLKSKLDKYWKKQRQIMDVSLDTLNDSSKDAAMKFPSNVQKRDTSNGYKAVYGDVGRKEVILTFDDGPHGTYTQTILDALAAFNAKAIFFAQGMMVKAHPELVKKEALGGHAVGSHSMTHACLGTSRICDNHNIKHIGHKLSREEAIAEIRGGHQQVYNALGFVEPFFRFPYGESSSDIVSYLYEHGTANFMWAIDSNDWKAQSNGTMLANLLSNLEARQRGIILMHDVQRKTAEVLPQLLKELYIRGYSVVLLQSTDANAKYNSQLVTKTIPRP